MATERIKLLAVICMFTSHRWTRRIEPTDLYGDSFCSRCGAECQWDIRDEEAAYWAAVDNRMSHGYRDLAEPFTSSEKKM
jgi:hypothetical protein